MNTFNITNEWGSIKKNLFNVYFSTEKRFNLALSLGIGLWAIFFFVCGGYKNTEWFSNFYVLLMDICIVTLGWKVYQLLLSKNDAFFLWLFISYSSILLGNINYTVVFGILQQTHPTFSETLLYIIPYLGFLTSQSIFWFLILKKHIFKFPIKILPLAPFFLGVAIVLNIFIVSSLILVKNFSIIIILQMISGAADLIILNMAILVLICSQNKGMYLIALASSMIMTTNFWWMYLFHNQALGVKDYSASFWLLALILMAFGLIFILKIEKKEIASWFNSLQGIKSQVTLWTFSLAILSILFLFLIGYSFHILTQLNIASIPFLITIYSVIVVLISNYIGNMFEKPFKRIQDNIESLMERQDEKNLVKTEFYTDEFTFLQNFIIKMFNVYEEKNKEKKAIAELALQVVHDIRSPVASILMLSKECLALPENQRISMRDAANRVQDIANYLLYRYEHIDEETTNEKKHLLVSAAILSVISEKKLQFKNIPIFFLYEGKADTNFLFIEINNVEFKRMLSNLINNSVEAIEGEGVVTIQLIQESNAIKIKILDTGKGMNNVTLQKIMNGEKVTSNKSIGHGLGFAHANDVLKKYNAKMTITSELDKGTQITLIFNPIPIPIWITEEIKFSKDSEIIILDDDTSIHGAWDEKFSAVLRRFKNIKITHFIEVNHCMDYIFRLSDKENILLLVDYEFINQTISGLDIINATKISHTILVTSYYERIDIIKRAILLNTKIIPKIFASDIRLTASSGTDSAELEDENQVNLVVLEDNKEFADILAFLYRAKGKKMHIYHDVYQLLTNLSRYSKETAISIDYDLGCPVSGIELAKILEEKGFNKLYLSTGFSMNQEEVPAYLHVLKEKMELLNL